ncbi:MAG TPA: hypothetical protein VL486_09535 [Verrucomicrobiae bacterium]|nr:hypothetical protein [Verrucomicrobiae bacterium]
MRTNIDKSPDIRLAGLSIWIHGWQFPEAADYWDGNWLRVTARCEGSGACVEASGAFIQLPELKSFASELARLNEELKGEATLKCIEPTISIHVEANTLGHVTVTVDLTPDHLMQKHSCIFEIDQSYLSDSLEGCRRVLKEFPMRENPSENTKRGVRKKE